LTIPHDSAAPNRPEPATAPAAAPGVGAPQPAARPEPPDRGAFAGIAEADWSNWRWQQSHRLRRLDEVDRVIGLTDEERRAFVESADLFDVAITPYYASLTERGNPSCPIRLQAIPQAGELVRHGFELDDPLAEEAHMPVPGITHRYPDRVLLYVTHNCPVYCRHCTRKRKVADPDSAASRAQVERGIDWLRGKVTVRDVLISGGDPLTLSDERLDELFAALTAIPHLEVFRLGTRNPVTLPQRITPGLCDVLSRVRPLYLHTHFNHPRECTPEAARALDMLADAGCVLGNQMVLLKGVNDDADTVLTLNRWLLRHRCRPYYIFQADMAAGITHFRTPLSTGLGIIEQLRGRISGMGVPHFAVDLPGGGGKITLTPDYEVGREGNVITFRNGSGRRFEFHDVVGDSADPSRE
jgi:lysine 2,3-aminomutase